MMKFRFTLTLLVIVVLATALLSACHNTPTPESSIGESSTEESSTEESSADTSENTVITDVQWDMTTLPEPTAVDSFDVPVMICIGNSDTDLIPQRLYYNGEVKESGYYEYLGEWNDRYYFRGIETYAEEHFICSCDKNYANFEKHSDIMDAIGYRAFLYNGVMYNWRSPEEETRGLYAYDLATKEQRLLIDENAEGYKFGYLTTITDGWIFSRCRLADDNRIIEVIVGYQIQTGQIVEKPYVVSGDGADGVLYGYKTENGDALKPWELVAYDPLNEVLTEIEEVKNPNGVLVDDDGDLWVKDMHEDGENYTLRKLCDAQTADNANANMHEDAIVNGWYYYRYTPAGSEAENLARLNLTTGKTEYCPNINADKYFEVQPHYWGYTREQVSETGTQ